MAGSELDGVRVVILAGGKGARLRPYTTCFPKPLMPIGDMPIIEVVLRQLRSYGFRKITVSVNHLAELIQTFCGNGAKWGLDIQYCVEDRPLGTAGSIGLVNDVTDPLLVMNGDLLTTIDYAEMVQSHVRSGACATIGIFDREVKIDFGVLDVDSAGDLVAYTEKPRMHYAVSMGVNVLSRAALDFIAHGQYLDIPTLMMSLKSAGRRVGTFRSACEWLDIGRPDDYEQAIAEFERSKAKYLRERG
jgi:NDP-mannose synthase